MAVTTEGVPVEALLAESLTTAGLSAAALTDPGLPARTRLTVLPTPLVAAPRLGAALACAGRLYVKRDDLTGFAFGGNKARPLEFLLGAAAAEGADTLVTGGAAGSNFCAAAAAAARTAGLACELVIAGAPAPPGPALALARSWGAAVRWTGDADRGSVDAGLRAAAADLAAAGRRPYVIPRGGATAVGATGYALAAFELAEQLAERGVGTARVIVPVGSGGTLAGLVAGNVLLGRPLTLVGASASRPPAEAARRVLALAAECARILAAALSPGLAGRATAEVTEADVTVADVRGPGHGLPSAAGTAAAEQALTTEGLMADPVYTAKALTLVAGGGALDTVFWHTGGLLDAVALAEAACR
jgi:1-aminocyclopropane-1-carboxylate deaminase/D-cysteine desulfhydrase-like pyridoxal-dependent ACC family enzyme